MIRVFSIRSASLASLTLAAALSGCATTPTVRPTAPQPVATCAAFSFPIYFETGSDRLTQSARAVIADAGAGARRCYVSRIEVLGLADADGPAHRNLILSRQRADTVAKALVGVGLPGPHFDVEALGEAGARAADGKPDPMRRRTEVVIQMSPPPLH